MIKLAKAYKSSSNVLKEIVKLSKEKYKQHVAFQETVNKMSHLVALSSNFNMFCLYGLNVRNLYACGTVRNLYACGTLADIKDVKVQ